MYRRICKLKALSNKAKYYSILIGIMSVIVGLIYAIGVYGETEAEVGYWGFFSIIIGAILVVLPNIIWNERMKDLLSFFIIFNAIIQMPAIILWFIFHGTGISDGSPPSLFIAHWGYSIPHILIFTMSGLMILKGKRKKKNKLANEDNTIKGSETIAYFRNLDFFDSYRDKKDDEIYKIINQKYNEEWGMELNPEDKFYDLNILRFDTDRVWWEDTEADVCKDNKVYTKVLYDIQKISRGSFNIVDIEEKWESETGPVNISFKLNEKEYFLNPQYMDDYIDINIFKQINEYIKDTEFRIEVFEPFDQTAFVIALNNEEKQKLINERNWDFWTVLDFE